MQSLPEVVKAMQMVRMSALIDSGVVFVVIIFCNANIRKDVGRGNSDTPFFYI